MARINVEDSLFTDARYEILAEKYGRYAATGMIVHAWKTAQKYFLTEDRLIPINIWEMLKLEPIEECGLAERRDNGVYVKGTSDQFRWLEQKKLAGQKSGDIRRERNRTPVERSLNETEHPLNENEPLTLTLTPTLTQTNLNTVAGRMRSPRNHKKIAHPLSNKVWDAYASSMERVYGHKPPRNAKVIRQCSSFIDLVGEDIAVQLAGTFPMSRDPYHDKAAHCLDVMLQDHAKLALSYKSVTGK